MASVVLVVGLLTYVSIKKIREHKEEKRALRKYELGIVEVMSPFDDNNEQPPFYQKDRLASCPEDEQHHALRSDKRSMRHFKFPHF